MDLQVIDWNDTLRHQPHEVCLHHLFESQVARTPDAVAICFRDQQVTYQQLNRRANRLALRLQSLCVGPDVIVGILVERSIEMLVCMLAILKAGGAYVPLDPIDPLDRLTTILQDSGLKVLLTDQPSIEMLQHASTRTVLTVPTETEGDLDCTCSEPFTNPSSEAQSDNLAYVIYTSGSTGKPKGVMITHRNVVSFIAGMDECIDFSGAEPGTWLAVTSLSFDTSVLELFWTLCRGFKVVLHSSNHASDNRYSISEQIARHNVTHLQCTPSMVEALLLDDESSTALGSLQQILIGGEPFPPSLAKRLARETNCAIFSMYGHTESTIWSTAYRLTAAVNSVPLGRPIADTQCYILDEHLHHTPVDEAGELYIGGDGVGRGYLNRVNLTEGRFIRNPFSSLPGSRMYRTGDLARFRENGEIEYLGRVDHQVKIRGHRIDLGEIERALSDHPSVSEAAVVAHEDIPGDKQLIAYAVLLQDDISMSDLRDYLHKTLPGYMVPSAFVFMEKLPLTPNGKVDRKSLPLTELVRLETTSEIVAPKDIFQIRLAQLWQEVLELPEVGIRDDFFDLGGNSVRAVYLLTKIESTFSIHAPISILLEAPTIEKLAAFLNNQNPATCWPALVPIQPQGTKSPIFCLHRDDGIVMCYRDLALQLGLDQPVYGIHAQALHEGKAAYMTVEQMSVQYVEEICSFYPDGPYLLIGSSFGGILAYEVAQQLRVQGKQVALLALLDTFAPVAIQKNLYHKPIAGRLPIHLTLLGQADIRGKFSYLANKIQRRVKQTINPVRDVDADVDENTLAALREIQSVNWQAYQDYAPKVYPNKMHLFRAEERNPFAADNAELWWDGMVTGGLEILDVPGNHLSMLKEPHVRVLAKALNESINKALQTS